MNERSRSKRVKNVLSLQVARERARQAKGASDRQIPKRSNPRLLERLEAENAQLRARVVELILEIRALRDGGGSEAAISARIEDGNRAACRPRAARAFPVGIGTVVSIFANRL